MRRVSPQRGDWVIARGHVFDDRIITEEVYKRAAQPIVQATLEGFNGTPGCSAHTVVRL